MSLNDTLSGDQSDIAPDGCWWCRVLPGEPHLPACDRTMRALGPGNSREIALERARVALAITQRTAVGSFERGWTIFVTGHEMNTIRAVLAWLAHDSEE
jgi:hypothetical protein